MTHRKLMLLIFLIVAIWAIIPPVIINFYPSLEKSSQFSDLFNIANSLFSGLGFIAIIYTIRIQQKEIQDEIITVNKTNKISYLTTLLTYYSTEEEKYLSIDSYKANESKMKKENILSKIETEINHEIKSR